MRPLRVVLAAAPVLACMPALPADPPDAARPQPVEPAAEPSHTPGQTPDDSNDAPISPAEEPSPAVPARLSTIGSSCADVPDGVSAQCDAEGIAVSLSAPVDTVPDIPWERIQVIHEATGLDRGASIKVGNTGERLWIQHVSCGICRRILGVAIVADLDRLSDEQRRRIQDEAGVPTDPVLRTVEDWRRTLAPQ